MAKKIDEDDLKAMLDSELYSALGHSGKLNAQRQAALYFYRGEAKHELAPPEADGRSSVVSTDLLDVVEWIMPQLVKIFCGSQEIVQFAPRGPEDYEMAAQATDYCNYIFFRRNRGFIVAHDAIKDALLQKLGVVKVWWDDSEDVTIERYAGLTDDQLFMLQQDASVELMEDEVYPDAAWQAPPPEALAQMHAAGVPPPQQPMLHRVKLKRARKGGRHCVEAVPPEEFLHNRQARTLSASDPTYRFAAHVQRLTMSDLVARGYKPALLADIGGNGSDLIAYSEERIERAIFDDDFADEDDDAPIDESQRSVWVAECYYRVDYNGDGIAEWRRIVKAGGVLLENEECEEPAFAAGTPIKMPHRLHGLSIYDLLRELQRIKTALTRQVIDGAYIANNPRYYVDMKAGVNLEDLLVSRPGGIVRGHGPAGVTPLITQSMIADGVSLLQYMDQVREDRSGVTKYTQGTDDQSLNKTAHGLDAIMAASNQRIELIARVLAETLFKDIFLKILRLSTQYQDRAEMIQLRGKWVEMNPRQWHNQFDVIINVGLGSNNQTTRSNQIMQMIGLQTQALQGQIGVVTPKNIYESGVEMAKSLGFADYDRFLTDPGDGPHQQGQQQQDPNASIAAAEVQKAQITAQKDLQIAQMKLQQEAQKQQDALAMERYRAELDAQVKMDLGIRELQYKYAQMQVDIAKQQSQQTKDAADLAIRAVSAMDQEAAGDLPPHLQGRDAGMNGMGGMQGMPDMRGDERG